ncbi:MAG TPA: SRPBCC family protein, partial [Polyangiaceae bacterium]|nr:SRPBCC family protein [Polyangiaceae bacterium]
LIVMNVGGLDLPHRGEYLEIERYQRLVFTWNSAPAGEGSRVTLRFEALPNEQTRLTLEHAGLAQAARAPHQSGWTHILGELTQLST